ncbi:MAG TPA: ABC transporter substrate-binding protein [Acidimicrobiales bacterium]|nr:ABC transporter substrate-binding protein [Acidimicrobiales bacterium]
MSRRTSRWIAIGASAVTAWLVLSLLPAAGATSGESPTGSALVFAEFNPFSGPDASFGPEMLVACDAAVLVINQNGGVLNHKATCKGFDTHGDPADAVPAAEQMVATTSGLAGVIGPSSDEALATVPILNRADVPMFADTGQAAFDKTTDSYFWRVSPADDVKGYAMAIWAHEKGYTRAAVVFGNDIGSQSNVPTLVRAFELQGGMVVSNLSIALDATSYRTEIESMLSKHPQVIFTEEDPATAATFLSELESLNHNKLLPIVGSEVTLESNWIQAVSHAVGSTLLKQYLAGVQPYAPTSGPAYKTFNTALFASKAASKANLEVYSTDPYAMGYYDSVNIMALAMIDAHSTSRAVYNKYIATVSNPGKNKVVVTSFAAGKAALAAGKSIQYVGASGVIDFNKWHNSTGPFEIAGYVSAGKIKIDGTVSAADIAKLSGR